MNVIADKEKITRQELIDKMFNKDTNNSVNRNIKLVKNPKKLQLKIVCEDMPLYDEIESKLESVLSKLKIMIEKVDALV